MVFIDHTLIITDFDIDTVHENYRIQDRIQGTILPLDYFVNDAVGHVVNESG